MTTRRRSSGEGSVSEYKTAGGAKWLVSYYATNAATGEKKRVLKRGFTSKKAAQSYLRNEVTKVDAGLWADPSKRTLGDYLDEWAEGHRIARSTRASYKKNIRLHVKPHLGGIPLSQLRATRLNTWMRELEASGRVDGKGGLSPRTVRYVYTILQSAVRAALEDGLLTVDPMRGTKPPAVSEARAPEMHPWTAEQLNRFLTWVDAPATGKRRQDPDLAMGWRLLAATGMRRGEALALRWRDIDFENGRLAVRRSVGVIKEKGAGQELVEGPTKGKRSRVIDVDAATLAALRTFRAQRGGIQLGLARDDALVLGRTDTGGWRHPERYSQRFADQVGQAQRHFGESLIPTIRLHDLRHTHATLLLAAGEPPKVVSERLGHTTVTITLEVYDHVMPGMGRNAAARYAALLGG